MGLVPAGQGARAIKDGSVTPARATLEFEEFNPQSAAFKAMVPTARLDLVEMVWQHFLIARDYGKTFVRQPRPTELGEAFVTSVGVGLRLGLGGRFSASLDLARQIEEVEVPGAAHHRLHVKVNLSY